MRYFVIVLIDYPGYYDAFTLTDTAFTNLLVLDEQTSSKHWNCEISPSDLLVPDFVSCCHELHKKQEREGLEWVREGLVEKGGGVGGEKA